MSVIKVKFDRSKYDPSESREYAYFCDFDVEVGDRVIVDSPYYGYTTVTVSDTSAGLDSIKATKEVVCKIDDSRYRARKAAKERMAEISAELAYRADRIANTKKMRKLFKGDEKALDLLAEAEGIGHVLNDNPEAFLESVMKRSGIEMVNVDFRSLEKDIAGLFSAEYDAGIHNGPY